MWEVPLEDLTFWLRGVLYHKAEKIKMMNAQGGLGIVDGETI